MLLFAKRLILKGKKFTRANPSNLLRENSRHFDMNISYECPDLYVYFFRKVYLIPDSTLFIFRIWPIVSSFLFYKGRIKHHSIKGIIDIQRLWKCTTLEKLDKPYLIIRSEEHTSELQSPCNLVCRLLLEKKKRDTLIRTTYLT